MALVNIVISDRGWILERLAEEITKRLPYVQFDNSPDIGAVLQYYITYSARKARASQIEVALFTHRERDAGASEQFFEAARSVDHCVTMAPFYEQELREAGIADVTTIAPGVDLEAFVPKIKIGVVGRTYHTGRKGEKVLAEVMDIPSIEWFFTGAGWPGPALNLATEEMPDFYRRMDYILVPALYEGGPMCVPEALACGTKVIAPPIGWVPNFSNVISYKTGDADDLRRVLCGLVEEKAALRQEALAYSWDAWAENHHVLFTKLLKAKGYNPTSDQERTSSAGGVSRFPSDALKVVVAVHGTEMTGDQGGPSIRAPQTTTFLRRIGVDARFEHTRKFNAEAVDLVHVFNVWHPDGCLILLEQIRKAQRATVLSPIYLDLSEYSIFTNDVPNIFRFGVSDAVMLAYEALRAKIAARRASGTDRVEPMPGYFKKVQQIISYADHLIFLSKHEENLLEGIGIRHPSTSIVYNPVSAKPFSDANPDLFKQKYGISDYVLCVGRIERRKNQLALAYALRDTDYPLVFIGHSLDKHYMDLVQSVAGPNTHFIGRVDPGSELLASAYAGARVFCLPSWAEGAPLVALEAAAAGCSMVLSNRSSEREYFGALATYCDPANPAEIRALVTEAYERPRSSAEVAALKDHTRTLLNWETYAERTRDAYTIALSAQSSRQRAALLEKGTEGKIFIDLTTLAYRDGPPSGIARTEDRLSVEFLKLCPERVRLIVWNSYFRCFIPVERETFESGNFKFLKGPDAGVVLRDVSVRLPYSQIDITEGDTIVLFGGAWIRNPHYLHDLLCIKRARRVSLVATVYDVIQWKFMNWFPKGIGAEFTKNLERLLQFTDRVITCSECSASDIRDFAIANNIPAPPIDVFKLGDEAKSIDPDAELQMEKLAPLLDNIPFILYVSALDVRKNHRLLLDLWTRLVAEYGAKAPKLVLVGSVGWGGEEIVKALESSPALKTKVFVLLGINDLSLEWLYRLCFFTVYPSHYEGWGLPVAESLRHGKFCIASSAGSLSEIAPDKVEMVDPLDFSGWYQKIVKYAFSPSLTERKNKIASTYLPFSWTESAQVVLGILGKASSVGAFPRLDSNDIVTFNSEIGVGKFAADYVAGGWGGFEKNGCWTVGTKAVFIFQVDPNPAERLSVHVTANGFVPQGQRPQTVKVLMNGVAVAYWSVGNEICHNMAEIYPELIGPQGNVELIFEILRPLCPKKFAADSKDERLLGLFVRELKIIGLREVKIDNLVDFSEANVSSACITGINSLSCDAYVFVDIFVGEPTTVSVFLDNKQVIEPILSPPGRIRRIVRIARRPDSFDAAVLSVRGTGKARISLQRVGFFVVIPADIAGEFRSTIERTFGGDAVLTDHQGHVPWLGRPLALTWDHEITITKDVQIGGATAGGWHEPEARGMWSTGAPSSLYFRVIKPAGPWLKISLDYLFYDAMLILDGRAHLTVTVGRNPPVTITRELFGRFIDIIEVLSDDAIDDNGIMRITFSSAMGVPPTAVLGTRDPRRLAFIVYGVNIGIANKRERLCIVPGTVLRFVEGDIGKVACRTLSPGWYAPEGDGVWSSGRNSSISLTIDTIKEQELILKINLIVYEGALTFGPVDIRFVLNGTEIAVRRRNHAFWGEEIISFAPADLIAEDGKFILKIETNRSAQPSAIYGIKDSRILSFKIVELAIYSADKIAEPSLNDVAAPFAKDWGEPFLAYPLNQWWRREIIDGTKYLDNVLSNQPSGLRSVGGRIGLRGGFAALDPSEKRVLSAIIVANGAEEQDASVSVFVNGVLVGNVSPLSNKPVLLTADIPNSALGNNGRAEIVFLSMAASGVQDTPIQEEIRGGDFIILDINLQQNFAESAGHLPNLHVQDPLKFSPDGSHWQKEFLSGGWYGFESSGVWSIGELGRLNFSVNISEALDEVLVLDIGVISTGNPNDTVTIQLLGTEISTQIDVTAPDIRLVNRTVNLEIGRLLSGGTHAIAVEFARSVDFRALAMRFSNDERFLGVRLISVEVIKRLAGR